MKDELELLDVTCAVYTNIEDFHFGWGGGFKLWLKLDGVNCTLQVFVYMQDAIARIGNWVAAADFEGSVSCFV